MNTIYMDMDKLDTVAQAQCIDKAARIIQSGGLVAFPTETVYGLGADGLNPDAVDKIYTAKGRPSDNPLILHIAGDWMLEGIVASINDRAATLMDAFWPGPLTLVLPKTSAVPSQTSGGLDTVAVRWPSHAVAQQLILAAAVPIAAPSANTSGRPSPTDARAVREDLEGKIECIIDSGDCAVGLESTVVDCMSAYPVILRPGSITAEMIETVLGETALINYEIQGSDAIPRAPGMKYRHYAPRAPLYIFDAEDIAQLTQLREFIARRTQCIGLIISEQSRSDYSEDCPNFVLAKKQDINCAAANIFKALRYMDEIGVEIIFAEAWPEHGIGAALMNRLRKAAGSSNIIKLFNSRVEVSVEKSINR